MIDSKTNRDFMDFALLKAIQTFIIAVGLVFIALSLDGYDGSNPDSYWYSIFFAVMASGLVTWSWMVPDEDTADYYRNGVIWEGITSDYRLAFALAHVGVGFVGLVIMWLAVSVLDLGNEAMPPVQALFAILVLLFDFYYLGIHLVNRVMTWVKLFKMSRSTQTQEPTTDIGPLFLDQSEFGIIESMRSNLSWAAKVQADEADPSIVFIQFYTVASSYMMLHPIEVYLIKDMRMNPRA